MVSIMTAVAVDRVVEETRPKEGPYDEGLERAKIASSLAFLVGMIQVRPSCIQQAWYLKEHYRIGFC